MTDLARNNQAIMKLIEHAVNKLYRRDPEHELLRFTWCVSGLSPWPDDLWQEYRSRFGKNGKATFYESWTAYLVGLEQALGERDADGHRPRMKANQSAHLRLVDPATHSPPESEAGDINPTT